jgi:hypothetical protein
MIPFGSQRGLGQDLATHLLNEHDNERVDFVDVRGAIAQDLHGAFAEWEAQAACLTKCKNYLYSLSINPDPNQPGLSHDQYMEYIQRVEQTLGLSSQPRAVVFHEKYGRHHCHVVWSRIDAEQEKAVHIAFDKEKLMTVTREFARDHAIQLPQGYFKDDKNDQTHQITLYEQEQERSTGISLEERKEQITSAWRESDSAQAFVAALAARGYMLATGNRPYVLVDLYGEMNTLPKLIDDKTVRTKDVRAFLENDYPPESLPSVEEAKRLVADYRETLATSLKNEQRETAFEELRHSWDHRRESIATQHKVLTLKQYQEREQLAITQREERRALKRAYIALSRAIQSQREESAPSGLAAFLGRVSGIDLIRKKIYAYREKRRFQAYSKKLLQLRKEQERQRLAQAKQQKMQQLDMQRKIEALAKIEEREKQSLAKQLKAKAWEQLRGGTAKIPAVPFTVKGQKKTLDRRRKEALARKLEDEFDNAVAGAWEQQEIDLAGDFARATSDEKEEDKTGTSEGPRTKVESRRKRRPRNRQRRRRQDRDRGR